MIDGVKTLVKYIGRKLHLLDNHFAGVWPEIDNIDGWLVPGQEKWLYETAKSLRDGARIVEIGCFNGRSTSCFAFACRGSRKHVFSIDLFGGLYADAESRPETARKVADDFLPVWRANMDKNGLSDYVTPLRGNSHDIAGIWSAPIDMLFIDGSHVYEDVVKDFDNFFPHVVPGGIVAMHDVIEGWDGCFRAWHEHVSGRLENTGRVSTIGYGYKPGAARK